MPYGQSWAGNAFATAESLAGQSWAANNFTAAESPAGQPVSLLPVPYQEQVAQSQQGMQMIPFQPMQTVAPFVPTPVHTDEAAIVYVPPMYTKPRPIIPRYRVISGLLSFLIVCTLLCVGAGYYAQTTGKLDAMRRLFTDTPPTSLPSTQSSALPDPPQKVDLGPAYGTIPSAIVTSHIDPNNSYFAVKADITFKVGQVFYIIYSVQNPKTKGQVTIKWYTNSMIYKQETSQTIAANPNGLYYGKSPMQYAEPAEGIVELYWNNVMAQRLYFVVR